MMTRSLILVSVAASALATFGFDAEYANPNGIDHAWVNAANWKVGGEAASEPPVTASDTATLNPPAADTWPQRRVHFGTDRGASYAQSFTVGAVYGTMAHMLMNLDSWQSGNMAGTNVIRVLNPNGFTGFWGGGNTRPTYQFPASATFTPEIHNLDIQGRTILDVGDVGTAKVHALYNPGVLEKRGLAKVELEGSIGGNAHLYLTTGEVTLVGHAADDTVEAVLKRAYLHLDASVSTSLGFLPGSETSVTNWHDVRDASLCAWVPVPSDLSGFGSDRVKVPSCPFVATETSPTGLQLLDFGSCHQDGVEPAYGPTNCCLRFPKVTNGSEVFYVTRYHAPLKGMNAVLGDVNLAPMQPYGGAYFGGSANRDFRAGMFLRDGLKTHTMDMPADGLTNLTVMSFGPATNATLSTIGVDQLVSTRAGGMLIGEIVIFTNKLTSADRQRVHTYLRHKWILGDTGAAKADLGTVLVDTPVGSETAIGVPSGHTARVMDLVAGADRTIVKTGDGDLIAGTLQPTNVILDIRGGSLSVHNFSSAVDDSSIAANPLVRLDASATGTVATEYSETYATNFVTGWSDCRAGVDITAVPHSGQALPNRPVIAAVKSATGLPAVDFAYKSSSLVFPWYKGAGKVYCGFAVIRSIDNTHVPFFGSSNMAMERENIEGGYHCRFLSQTYPHPAASAALWTINGRAVDPIAYMPEYFSSSQNPNFMVVAFSAHQPLQVDAIAIGRDQSTRAGGVYVGEFILYDRELSDAERRNTEAYLMKKWLGKSHPAATGAPAMTPTYKFADTVDPVFDSDCDATVGFTGGTGHLIKRGAGNLVIPDIIDDSWKSISVEAGGLTAKVGEPTESIAYHFDASDPDKYLTVREDGDKKYVTSWNDVRDNGLVATNIHVAHANGSYYNGGSGTVVQVTFPSGESRTGVDCGSFGSGTTGAAYGFSQKFTTIREGFTVWQNQNQNWQCALFGSYPSSADYYRANDGRPFSTGASSANVRNGEIWVDGVETNNDIILKDNTPHVLNVRTLGNTTVNAISMIQCFGGGQVLFEQFALTEQLTPRRRKYWQDYLTWKWFGKSTDPKPVWTNACLSTVSVAADATLTFTGAANPIVSSLSGAGTITATELCEVATLAAEGADVVRGDHLTVTGKVSFADDVTVTLSGSGKLFATVGDYTLLEASEGFGNADDPTLWNFDISAFRPTRIYSLVNSGKAIILRVKARGLTVIVR